jgi:hypothetical protein
MAISISSVVISLFHTQKGSQPPPIILLVLPTALA